MPDRVSALAPGDGDAMAQTGRVLAIDYGRARIGLALSDPGRILASALETIQWNGVDRTWADARILELCRQYAVNLILVGLPRRSDGRPGEMESEARAFADALREQSGLPLVLQDERYTSVMAGRILQEAGRKKARRRAVIDQVAAELILQSYLDQRRAVL